MLLPLKIATRYLVSKKAHNAVNIISIVSVCGVVVATAALVCVLSVFNGFRGLIMGRLAMLDPQVAVTATVGKTIARADSVMRVVQAVDGVARAVPVVEDQALAVFADYQLPLRLKGVPDDYNRMNAIDSLMVDGRWQLHDEVSTYAVAGVGPALQLHVRPGYLRMLQIYAPQRRGRVNPANPISAFRTDSLFVGGVFQLQQNSYDADLMYVPIDVAERLFDCRGEATQIELRLSPDAHEATVMRAVEQALGPSYTVRDRLMQQAAAYRMVNIEKWMAFLLLGFILLIATFNVISTLSLLIIEKDESIDTLRSLGATNQMISRIFVAQSWLITIVGALAGVVLGLVLCLGQQHFGWLKLQGDPASMIVSVYPVQVIWTDLLRVAALVAAVGALTALVVAVTMRRRLHARTAER